MTMTVEQRAAAVKSAERAAAEVAHPFAGLTVNGGDDVVLLARFAMYLASHGDGVNLGAINAGLGGWAHVIDLGHVRHVRAAEASAEAEVRGHPHEAAIVAMIRAVGRHVDSLGGKNQNVTDTGHHLGSPFDKPTKRK